MQLPIFKIDLNRIDGEGDFPCPSCGTTISPDDQSESTYQIVSVNSAELGSLESLEILCRKCGCRILVEGFESLKILE